MIIRVNRTEGILQREMATPQVGPSLKWDIN